MSQQVPSWHALVFHRIPSRLGGRFWYGNDIHYDFSNVNDIMQLRYSIQSKQNYILRENLILKKPLLEMRISPRQQRKPGSIGYNIETKSRDMDRGIDEVTVFNVLLYNTKTENPSGQKGQHRRFLRLILLANSRQLGLESKFSELGLFGLSSC